MAGQVEEASSDTDPAGQVIGQNPAAGSQATNGASVNLTVSSGPASPGTGCLSENGVLGRFAKMIGDLFMGGLSLMTLEVFARRKI